MATHSSTLAWKIPWTEEPGGLQSTGSLRVGHDWAIHFHFSLTCIGEGNGNPLQCSCLENPRDGEAWWAAVHGVTKSSTRLSDFTFTFPFHALEKECCWMMLNGLPWKWTNVIFEIAPKYSISDSFDSDGYSIPSNRFLPTVVDIMIIWIKFNRSCPFWFADP